MFVKMKNNKGAVRYKNVSFVGSEKVEVTPEWFESCTNPRVVEVMTVAKSKDKDA